MFVDFDGTISPQDATDRILEEFAAPEWHAVEDEWKAGKIGSRECMARQIDLLRVSPADLDSFIATLEIDPGFPEFVAFCRRENLGVSVLSDGLDRAISGVLSRAGLDLAFKANQLLYLGGNRWSLQFPHAKQACTTASGNCKCATAMSTAAPATVMVGDGRSDFCISNRSTFVLAKASLLKHCETTNLPHAAYTGFAEATELLAAWLAQQQWMHDAQSSQPAFSSSRPKEARGLR